MSTEIFLAESAGFCMGVSLALNKLDTALDQKKGGKIFTFGPIIHNPQVLAHYEKKGVKIIHDPDEPDEDDMVLIRAHGVPLDIEEKLRRAKTGIIDATCPKVKKAQLLIAGNSSGADCLLLYGEPEHPEVKGLISYARSRSFLFESFEQLLALDLEKSRRYCLAAQTTQDREQFQEITAHLQKMLGNNLTILDTVCDATKNRQAETIDIAGKVECMIVVGGRNSGNTRRLCQVAAEHAPCCFHIETEAELESIQLENFSTFGLTAGASTPDDTINRVYHKLKLMAAEEK